MLNHKRPATRSQIPTPSSRRAEHPCPQAYLRDVLTRLPKMTTRQIPEVTPEAKGVRHGVS